MKPPLLEPDDEDWLEVAGAASEVDVGAGSGVEVGVGAGVGVSAGVSDVVGTSMLELLKTDDEAEEVGAAEDETKDELGADRVLQRLFKDRLRRSRNLGTARGDGTERPGDAAATRAAIALWI